MPKLSPEKLRQYKEIYDQESARINQYYSELRAKGFAFDEFRPPEYKEYVTKKDIDKLSNLTNEKILKKSYYIDDNGNPVRGDRVNSNSDEETVNDFDILVSELTNMILNYEPADKGLRGRPARSAEEDNIKLLSWLSYELTRDPDGLANRVAKNWGELVAIVDRVQNYVNQQGDVIRFSEIVSGTTLSLKDNIKYSETYNDSSLLPEEEIEDYDEI